jgi:hypothetical protein
MTSLTQKPFAEWTREDINDLLDIIEISKDKKVQLELLHLLYQYIDMIEKTSTSYYPYEIAFLKQYYMKSQQDIVYHTPVHSPSLMHYVQESIDDFQFNTPFNYIFMGVFILLCLFLRTLLYSSFFPRVDYEKNQGNENSFSNPYSCPSYPPPNPFEAPHHTEKKKGLEIRVPVPDFLTNNTLLQKIMEYVSYV